MRLLEYRFIVATLVAAVLGIMPVASLFAQVASGAITGRVADTTGAFIPGAEVTVTNEATNVVRSTVTNYTGAYRVLNLNPGQYTVKVEMAGFKVLESRHNQVTVGDTITVNLTMEVGDIAETLTVTTLSTGVDTEDSQPSTLVTSSQIVDLPLDGRNVYSLALLSPGVVPAMGSVFVREGAEGLSFMSAGTRHRGNNFTLDGSFNTDDGVSGEPVVIPSVDSVQEFRLIRNNFSAEYGVHSGSVVSVVTKSGTNELHGTVYYFHRNDTLDAADVFAAYDETTGEKDKSPLKQHQFGFTVGGPILSNKLFFFGGYEGFRQKRGQTWVGTVETPEFRRFVIDNFPGNASAQIFQEAPAFEPTYEIETVQNLIDKGGGLCYHCDLSIYPPDLPVRGKVNKSGSDTNDSDQVHFRVDWTISDRTQLFGRFSWNDGAALFPVYVRPNGGAKINDNGQKSLTFSLSHSFTPTLLNELRLGYNYGRRDWSVQSPHIPETWIEGPAAIYQTIGGPAAAPSPRTNENLQLQDIVSFNVGDHFIKMGGDYRRPIENFDAPVYTRPGIVHVGLFDFALDAPYYIWAGINPQTGELVGTPREFRAQEVGVFVQDDWKVNPRLTLNLGLRWDYFAPPTEADNKLSNIRFPAGDTYYERIESGVVGPVGELYYKDLNNFAPRFGFAYDVSGDGRMSIRGGYGISYDKIFFNVTANSRLNPPYFAYALVLGDDLSRFPLIGDDPSDPFGGFLGQKVAEPQGFDEFGAPNGLSVSLRLIDPNIRDSYVHNFFLGVQQELPWEMVAEFNIQATYGKKLSFIGDPNRFNGDLLGWANPLGKFEGDTSTNRIHKSFTGFNLRQNRITSNYHGFNVQLAKRMALGLSFQMAYTLGKSLDFNSDVFGYGYNPGGADVFFVDPVNLAIEYGRSNFDIRHRFVSNFIWEIPYRREEEGVLSQLLGGWQVTGILPIQTGLPFGAIHQGLALYGGDFNRDGRAYDRPDEPSFGNSFSSLPSNSEFISGIWEHSDFPVPEEGQNGTLGKNTYSGPHYWTFDMGLFKNFIITEESRLQFRAEFFNLFNKVNFHLPGVRLDKSSSFGQSTRSFTPREIQLALKLVW